MANVNLSIHKFNALLNKNRFTSSTLYYEDSCVRFIECKTPTYQKTFIVFVPQRYIMRVPPEVSVKVVNIKSTLQGSPRQISHIAKLKGPLLECDLISISSDSLCLYKNSGDASSYTIIKKNQEEDVVEDAEQQEEVDGITQLEEDTDKIIKKTKSKIPKVTLPPLEGVVVPEKEVETESETTADAVKLEETVVEPKSEVKDSEVEEGTEPTELEFQTEDGEPYDEVKHKMNEGKDFKLESDDVNSIDDGEKTDTVEEDEVDELQITTRDNELPEQFDSENIDIGEVYVSVDLRSFFKRITSELEKELLECYEQLEENVVDMRNDRVNILKTETNKLIEHLQTRLNNINEEEKKLKTQLIRLTAVLTKINLLRNKFREKAPKGNIGAIPDTDRVYNQTRKTIYELNMELLKTRDEADELLYNYETTIAELLEL